MAHPTLTKNQAIVVNVIALGMITALTLLGVLNSISLESSEAETPVLASPSENVGLIDTKRILAADEAPGDWLAYGRDYGEQRFSPLTQVNKQTIGDLELAWSFDMYTNRGLEASPIIVDGIMYMTGSWSVVFAVNAKTGEEIWSYDPEVPGDWARKACCDVVNRGVAVYEGAVYLATLDGYLVSLNAETGEVIWRINTIIDRTRAYTITGAPRVANGRVFIGNGGGEYGVRGYVSAFDTKSGELDWRFFTVPGDPSKPFEHPELELAAETWKGGEWWKIGGGGTVWNSIVYDAETDTVFLGVGNGSPWTRTIRSPGGGDNLFLSAIVAVNASTGEMRWYYQTTPGDNWDYTAVQDMMLADMEVDGKMRKVIMQAPKNGFFYVLDRQTGELLRANPYVTVNWASHVDMETGRPVENPDKDFLTGKSKWILPGPLGGHNWQSMSYNPNTGLVYIPALENPLVFDVEHDFKATGRFKYIEGGWNTGIEFGRYMEIAGQHPDLPKGKGYITAFDPLTGKTHWTREHGTHWNGGTLSTAADLVFQGNGDGYFVAYDAQNGDELWKVNTYTSTIAPPVTYSIDGEQYVAIQVGSGGAAGLTEGDLAMPASAKYGNFGRMLAFKINGGLSIDEPEHWAREIPEPPIVQASAAQIEHGGELYGEVCGFCHGIGAYGGPAVPDLRKMSEQTHRMFNEIVLEGVLEDRGMSNFSDRLSEADVNDIYAYINSRSWEDFKLQEEAKALAQSESQTSALAN